jgi:L-2-hydroxyglutarate oxidase LhgO
MDHFDITIVGAGVVGLAIAEALSGRFQHILVIDKNSGYGQETSSRNSEVIHAGIYYPADSLKAVLCVEGNRLIYEACRKRALAFRPVGKLIVATNPDEAEVLQGIKKRAEGNGVEDLSFLSRKETACLEPEIRVTEAVFSPSTGIIDSHALIKSFYVNAVSNKATIALRSEVTNIRYDGLDYEIETNHGEFLFSTRILINSAGLNADKIAALAGIDIDAVSYRLRLCKGSYFAASPAPGLNHLVYPVPTPNHEGLGVHATLDLGGRVRFGPDVEYVDKIEYVCAATKRNAFCEAIQKYIPKIRREYLHPDMSGIRPKLQGPGEPIRDFVITEEDALGYPGLINLIGIESPGLTSCLAIAQKVLSLVRNCLG